MSYEFIGLDFETSGVSHARSAPIQIGIATRENVFASLIGGFRWEQDITPILYEPGARTHDWSDQAQTIHKIDRFSDLQEAPHLGDVDALAASFVRNEVDTKDKTRVIAVGWNIAGFDFPFLREYFPLTTNRMSYRSVDLNAVIFTMVEAGVKDGFGDPWDYETLKSVVKNAAKDRVLGIFGVGEAWHDAGYDAITSLYAYDELQRLLTREAIR